MVDHRAAAAEHEGQAQDGKSAEDVLGGIGDGQILLADRAYDSDALRHSLEYVQPSPIQDGIPV